MEFSQLNGYKVKDTIARNTKLEHYIITPDITTSDLQKLIDVDRYKIIEFTKGIYTLTGRIYLKSNTEFHLNGSTLNSEYIDSYDDNLVFLGYPLNSTYTEYNGISNVKFINGKINTSFAFMHNTNIEFNNIEFDNINSHAIQIGGCKDFKIVNCTFNGSLIDDEHGNAHELIQLECASYEGQPYLDENSETYDNTGNMNITIDNCIFNKGDEEITRNYVCIGHHSYSEENKLSNKNVKITNNVFYDSYSSALSGGSFDNIIISNNIFEQDTTHSGHIQIRLRFFNENVYIYNNIFKGGQGGIYNVNIKQNKNWYIHDNQFNLLDSGSTAISINSIENCYINNNDIKSYSNNIVIQNQDSNVTNNVNIIENKIDMSDSESNKHSILLYGGTNILIKDNHVKQNNSNYFIWINGATSYHIANNKIISNATPKDINGQNIDFSNVFNSYVSLYQGASGTYSALDDSTPTFAFDKFNRLVLLLHKSADATVMKRVIIMPYSIYGKFDARKYTIDMNIDGSVKTAILTINDNGTFDYTSPDSITLRNMFGYNE